MFKTDVLFSFVFPDVCKNCDHVIARHEYTFTVDDEYQVSKSLCLFLITSVLKCLIWDLISALMFIWRHILICIYYVWVVIFVSRSTLCFACCVERQRTPSVCCRMIPDSLLLSSRAQQTPNLHAPFINQLSPSWWMCRWLLMSAPCHFLSYIQNFMHIFSWAHRILKTWLLMD